MMPFNVILFDGFETLDAFGPVEFAGKLSDIYRLGYFSSGGGTVISSHGVSVNTLPFSEIDAGGVMLIPGGIGTRRLVNDGAFIARIKTLAERAEYVLSVCTGAALLAQTGLLNGRRATSNKLAFDWVSRHGDGVEWLGEARWASDGKYHTSSGVSAGMDMILGFIRDRHGEQTALELCRRIEYIWNEDGSDDPFAI